LAKPQAGPATIWMQLSIAFYQGYFKKKKEKDRRFNQGSQITADSIANLKKA